MSPILLGDNGKSKPLDERDFANRVLRGFACRGTVTVAPQARAVWERELPENPQEAEPTPADVAGEFLRNEFMVGKVLDAEWFRSVAVRTVDCFNRAARRQAE